MRVVIDKIKADLIAKKYYETIYKFCYLKLGYNSHDAADITQEVFLFFQIKCDMLDDKNIRSWLFSVANYKIKEYFRVIGKQEATLIDIDKVEIEDMDDDIFEMLENYGKFDSENLEKYRQIIFEKLSENEQQLYNMAFVENKTNKQIAQELGITEKNVSVKLFRLRKKLSIMEALVLCTVGQFILKLFF